MPGDVRTWFQGSEVVRPQLTNPAPVSSPARMSILHALSVGREVAVDGASGGRHSAILYLFDFDALSIDSIG